MSKGCCFIMKKNKIILILASVLMVIVFMTNFLAGRKETVGVVSFENFQSDSEYLVISKAYYEKYYPHTNYGLALMYEVGTPNTRVEKLESKMDEKVNYPYSIYKSQVGLQGHIFNFMYNNLHIPFKVMNLLCSVLLAVVLMAICVLIYQKYGKILGIIFYLTFLLSPWVISFARNLYWVPFTWFLPALFGLLLFKDYKKSKVYIPLIYLAILIKCLCGYEYITTIMLFTIAFFVIDYFSEKDKAKRKHIFKITLFTGIACLLAFFTALLIHSYMRGDGNIFEGIKSIYVKDITRRTLNLPGGEFDKDIYKDSVNATTISTLKRYFNWTTNVVLGIEGKYFRAIFFVTILLLIYNYIKKEKNNKRDIIMFVYFLLTTISWYIIGKSHSYAHYGLNFVLWYFGFIQICLYVLFKNLCKAIEYISKGKIKD